MAAKQDLTIFHIEDDEEIIAVGYGELDIDGSIIEPTFSTDPAHPRPYLKRVLNIGESTVDFLKGSAVLGQMTIEIVDVPAEGDTQDQGTMTFLLATAGGDTALLGVRAVFREENADGDMEVIFDGVIGPVRQSKLTTYQLQLRDTRERERELKLFTRATGTCIFPLVGPKEGWGHTTEYDSTQANKYRALDVPTIGGAGSMVFPRIRGMRGQYKRFAYVAGVGSSGGIFFFDVASSTWFSGNKNTANVPADFEEVLKKYGAGAVNHDIYPGELNVRVFDKALVELSTTGLPGTYTQLPPIVGRVINGSGMPQMFDVRTLRTDGDDVRRIYFVQLQFTQAQIDAGLEPAEGAFRYIRVVSNDVPDENVPIFLEERLGETLKKAYDGDYSVPDTVIPVRYNAAAMQAMIEETPMSLARIDKPVDDGRAWLQENVYRVSGYAPTIRQGEVYPVKYEVPGPDAILVQLDDTNSTAATWEHEPSTIVNQVIFEYQREIVPTALPTGYVKPLTQKVIVERDRLTENSQRRHGSQAVTYKPVTLRSLVSQSKVATQVPSQELGGLTAMARSEELLRRYTNGAQVVGATCMRTTEIDALNEGDWVIGAWSWLPDYFTRERGFNRLLQIIRVRRAEPHLREFVLVDAGPYDVPMAQPTLDSMAEQSDGSVLISVSGTPVGGKIQVQFALGEEEPEANSGEWRTISYLTEDGDTRTPPNIWPGTLLWVRVRGTADGRRASAWTTPDSLRMSDKSIIRDFSVDIDTNPDSSNYGKPIVRWDHMADTGGVRVAYEVHDRNTEPPEIGTLADSVDVDADDASVTLPVVLHQWEQVTVQLFGYPGFAAGAVTGSNTSVSGLVTAQRVEGHYVKPSVGELLERDGLTGILTLEILDPQLQITSFWFRSREGTTGAWTSFAEDTSAPYGSTVHIVPGSSSAIGYEVYALDHNGVEHLFKSGTVEFPFEGIPSLLIRVTPTTGADPDNYAYFEVAVADPVPQGTNSITLTATGDATPGIDPAGLTTGGVGTGDPTDDLDTTDVVVVTVVRPPATAPGDGNVTFHADASERSAVEASVTIPRKEAPPEDTYDVINLSAAALGDVVTFFFDTDPASGWDHFRIDVSRTSFVSWGDGELQMSNDDDTYDTGLWGWNLNPSGMQVRTIYYMVRVFDADNNPVGTSALANESFNADPDT